VNEAWPVHLFTIFLPLDARLDGLRPAGWADEPEDFVVDQRDLSPCFIFLTNFQHASVFMRSAPSSPSTMKLAPLNRFS
jgi:hypothetical protein